MGQVLFEIVDKPILVEEVTNKVAREGSRCDYNIYWYGERINKRKTNATFRV